MLHYNQTSADKAKSIIISAKGVSVTLILLQPSTLLFLSVLISLYFCFIFSHTKEKVELYRMTYKCREFYCTKIRSLVRPQCSYGVTAGAKALE